MTSFKEMYGVGPEGHMLADKNYKEGKTPVVAPDLVVGLELEIEQWAGYNKFIGFSFKEDGSLRGAAIEAITKPTKLKFVETLLDAFFEYNKITKDNYSERCGTHVHVNVSDFNLDQLGTLCLLYQVFERSLFRFIGDDRDKNIFCVPWEQASINHNLVTKIKNDSKNVGVWWKKYTAMNILPLTSYGSVEFRHLPGTCDVKYIMNWLNLIASIHNYARISPYKTAQQRVIDLNTSSAYNAFAFEVFGNYMSLFDAMYLQQDMEVGVINAKLMSLDELNPSKKAKKSVALDNFLDPALGEPGQIPVNPVRNIWNDLADVRRAQRVIIDDLVPVRRDAAMLRNLAPENLNEADFERAVERLRQVNNQNNRNNDEVQF